MPDVLAVLLCRLFVTRVGVLVGIPVLDRYATRVEFYAELLIKCLGCETLSLTHELIRRPTVILLATHRGRPPRRISVAAVQ